MDAATLELVNKTIVRSSDLAREMDKTLWNKIEGSNTLFNTNYKEKWKT